jgi:hypothetical protein
VNHGMSMYGMGLQGMNDMAHMGLGASSQLGEDLASALMSQANLAYAGQANQNQAQQGGLGDIAGLLGSAASAFF